MKKRTLVRIIASIGLAAIVFGSILPMLSF